MSYFSNIAYRDSANLDAFARLRMSAPETIFDSKQLHDKQPQFWDDQQVSGSGTTSVFNTNQASTTLSVSASTAGRRVRQTFRRFNYQPGKSQLIIMTTVFGTSGAGITQRIGYFDDRNGLIYQLDSSGLAVGVRTYTSGVAVDNLVYQNNWNIDKMDGSGISGITLDTTKSQIAFMDMEWLGVGRIRFGFFINGVPYYVNEVLNANVTSLVYMSVPNLPLRYEIINDGTGGASSLVHICSTVISEGGAADTGFPYGASRGTVPLTTKNDALLYPLMAMRLKSNYLTSLIRILDLSIVCTSASAFEYQILLNPTVTGTAFSFSSPADIANSSIEVDMSRTGTTTVSGGTLLYSTIDNQGNATSGKSSILNSDFAFGSTIAGVSDIIVVAVRRLTGTSETFYGSINWKDQQ
jgi:hypothetical protein